jgi:hypothetical protein
MSVKGQIASGECCLRCDAPLFDERDLRRVLCYKCWTDEQYWLGDGPEGWRKRMWQGIEKVKV